MVCGRYDVSTTMINGVILFVMAGRQNETVLVLSGLSGYSWISHSFDSSFLTSFVLQMTPVLYLDPHTVQKTVPPTTSLEADVCLLRIYIFWFV